MLKVIFLLIVMGVIGLLLFGCNSGVLPIKNFPSQFVVEKYKNHGEFVTQWTIEKNDPLYQRLRLLLEQNKTGWQSNWVSYATGPYIFRGENLIIRCHKNLMVIDLTDSHVSVEKQIPNLLQKLGLPY